MRPVEFGDHYLDIAASEDPPETPGSCKDWSRFGAVEFIKKYWRKVENWVGNESHKSSTRKTLAELRAKRAFRPVLLLMVFLVVVLRILYDLATGLLVVLYCLARVYLVVESFINLFHLPDSAYLLPSWSPWVPHIGGS